MLFLLDWLIFHFNFFYVFWVYTTDTLLLVTIVTVSMIELSVIIIGAISGIKVSKKTSFEAGTLMII